MTEYQLQPKSQDCSHSEISSGGGKGAVLLPRATEEGGGPLPCLYSNNSIESTEETALKGLVSLLSPYWKKSAQTLYLNVERLCKEAESLGHIGFLTLTFKENIKDSKEASRRLNSLNSNFFNQDSRFSTKIITKEPQKRGAWHYHILITLSQDIKEGFNFEGVENRDYSSANPFLRQLWKDIRSACEKYGFGRSELMPIKSNAEAMGRYIGKYISKGLEQRAVDQKGVRLVTYSKNWTRNSPKFAWNTQNSAEWRSKLFMFARIHGCDDLYQLTDKLGSNWAYRYLNDIINVYESLGDYLEKYQPCDCKNNVFDGGRINKETGEVESNSDLEYQDKIFKRIKSTRQKKENLLMREAKNDIAPKLGYKHWQKTQRVKEQAKIDVEMSKYYYEKPEKIEKETSDQKRERRLNDAIQSQEKERRLSLSRAYLESIGSELKDLPSVPF